MNNNDEVVFDEHYYRHDCGVPYERNDHWLEFFAGIADAIVRDLAPTTVLDVGCAMGFLVEALRARGVEAWGIDVSEFAISRVDESVAKYCAVSSATDELPPGFPGRVDLVTCIEVVEHLPPAEGGAAVASLARWGRRVLFSSSPDDYEEATHLNVLPPEEWAAYFAGHGMLRSFDVDTSFLTPWAVLYEQAVTSAPAVVARYERRLARYQRETVGLRRAVVRMQRALADAERALTGKLDEAGFVSIEDAQTMVAHWARRERELQDELDRLAGVLQQQNEDVAVLHDNYQAAIQARDTAQSALAASVLHAEALERSLAASDARAGDLQALLNATDVRVQTLTADLDRERCATRDVQARAAQLNDAQLQLDAMRASTSWRLGRAVVRPLAGVRDAILHRRRRV